MAENEFAVCCGSCPFFVAQHGAIGLCHEGPGQVVAVPGPPNALGGPSFNTHTVLPPKKPTDWCGRHPMFRIESMAVPIDHRLAADAEGTG